MSPDTTAVPKCCEDCGKEFKPHQLHFFCYHCGKEICGSCFHSPRHLGRVGA